MRSHDELDGSDEGYEHLQKRMRIKEPREDAKMAPEVISTVESKPTKCNLCLAEYASGKRKEDDILEGVTQCEECTSASCSGGVMVRSPCPYHARLSHQTYSHTSLTSPPLSGSLQRP